VSPSRLRGVLLWITLVSSAMAWGLWPDRTRPNVAFVPDMSVSPAARTFAPVLTSRLPVSGTVARGSSPLHYEATEADALRAATELRMPETIGTADDRRWAGPAFAAFCRPCHGKEAHGDGLTIKRGFQPPPSLLTQHARDMKDGQMFHVLTYGQKLMPSQAAQLSIDDRWRLIRHVRELQQVHGVDPPLIGSTPPQGPPTP